MAETKTSTQFQVNTYDLLHGLLVAVLTPVFTIVIDSLNEGTLTFDWRKIGATAVAVGLGYLLKNFLTPSKIYVTGADKQDIKDVEAGDVEVKLMTK